PARAYRVSFDRPYHDNDGLARYPVWDKPFVQWMKGENRPFEVLSDGDLEDPSLLGHYDVAVLIGHSEYWTAAARASLEQFLAGGGRLAVLGGDTMWWQVRLEQRQLVCYKSAAADPESGHNDAVVTVNWYNEPVLRPENLVVGTSYRNANLTNRSGPVHSYTVTDAAHWIFDGAGVLNGSRFGAAAAGIEVDGAIHNCTATGLEAEGSDGTPLHFRILATVPSDEGRGTIGIYTTAAGGAVFNAATQNWTLGLGNDAVVTAVTRNVFDRFLAGRVPHEPVTSPWRMRDLFNCPLEPVDEKFLPGWRGEYGSLQISQRCAGEGTLGLELSGAPPRVLMHRSFAPAGNTTNRAVLDFSLNADASGGPAGIQAALVTLQSRKGTVIPRVARVEFQPSTRSVRLVLFNANNAPGVTGAWVPLAAGWNDVHVEWQSPGACTLRINGGPVQTLVNPLSNQKTGDVQITYDQAAMTGFLCLDALRVQ
ncbi:MAG TPA: N,N-dimethylformamidase beta subunit family domain-containing protein, partial [Thermoanaerobaculia bacterium]|nr:N,N-dimethylformamidase beta subunit family domain-containing protein [Thermoanaerobaculia bacterium]